MAQTTPPTDYSHSRVGLRMATSFAHKGTLFMRTAMARARSGQLTAADVRERWNDHVETAYYEGERT